MASWEPTSAPGKAHPELQQSPYVLSWLTAAAAATSPSSAIGDGSEKSALGAAEVAKQSKTPNRHTQLILYAVNYLVWYPHFQLSPVISLHLKYCLKILLSCCSSPLFTLAFLIRVLQLEKILVKTLLSYRGKGKTTILSPIDWLEGFPVPTTHQYLYLISAFPVIITIEEGDFLQQVYF